jgi:hypothetical protein
MIASVAKEAKCENHNKMDWTPEFPPRFPPIQETLNLLVVSIIIEPCDVRKEDTSKKNRKPVIKEIPKTYIEIPIPDKEVTKEPN